MTLLNGIRTAMEVLTGTVSFADAGPHSSVPEHYAPTAPLAPNGVREYNELPFKELVKQGRVRCIEWHVVQGIEVGFDHDLMVWCSSPGSFHV